MRSRPDGSRKVWESVLYIRKVSVTREEPKVKEQTDPLKPKRIKALTRKFDDELLVYDERRHKAHCLNKTAAMVWLECTGHCTVPEISKKLEADFQSGGDDSLVLLCYKLDTFLHQKH